MLEGPPIPNRLRMLTMRRVAGWIDFSYNPESKQLEALALLPTKYDEWLDANFGLAQSIVYPTPQELLKHMDRMHTVLPEANGIVILPPHWIEQGYQGQLNLAVDTTTLHTDFILRFPRETREYEGNLDGMRVLKNLRTAMEHGHATFWSFMKSQYPGRRWPIGNFPGQ